VIGFKRFTEEFLVDKMVENRTIKMIISTFPFFILQVVTL